jgi:periplasmic protein TonB
MERALDWYSPKSAAGSVISAVVIHGLLYGVIVFVMGFSFLHSHEKIQDEVEIGYEVLNDVPAPTPVVQKVVRAQEPETPVDTKTPVDTTPKELQDEKSDVAGTQAAAKPQSNVGSESNGVANATPYYKIKPKYPKAALVSGVEGWILMKVDVNEKGEVENIRVVDGDKRNMFQDEARRAVEKWKYRPFLDQNGRPYRKTDHQVRVDFKLTDV